MSPYIITSKRILKLHDWFKIPSNICNIFRLGLREWGLYVTQWRATVWSFREIFLHSAGLVPGIVPRFMPHCLRQFEKNAMFETGGSQPVSAALEYSIVRAQRRNEIYFWISEKYIPLYIGGLINWSDAISSTPGTWEAVTLTAIAYHYSRWLRGEP